MLYSTSSYMAQINEGDDMFYFKKQALYSIGCLILAIVESYFDYHILAKLPISDLWGGSTSYGAC